MSTDSTHSASSLVLTEADVARLLEHRSSEVLEDITRKVAGQYTQHTLRSQDMYAAEQIFRLLLRETETRIRKTLAEHVRASRFLPRDIAMTMARDVREVALPILRYSEVLTESDLITLIRTSEDTERHLAIAQREQVSQATSDHLIATQSEDVASALAHNAGAVISEASLNRIVERYPQNKPMLSALVSRPQLPAAVAERLLEHVSDSLARTLKDKYQLPGAQIEQEVEEVRENETLNLASRTRDPQEIDKLVGQLMAYKRLTPSLVFSALCQGNLLFFEIALARLSGISMANTRALLNDRGDLGFRALYNRSSLPDAMYPAVRVLLRAVRALEAEGQRAATPSYNNRLVEFIIAYANDNPVENLSYLLALVRRNTASAH